MLNKPRKRRWHHRRGLRDYDWLALAWLAWAFICLSRALRASPVTSSRLADFAKWLGSVLIRFQRHACLCDNSRVMRTTLKVIAAILFTISALVTVIAIFALFADSSSRAGTNVAIVGGAVTSLLLSGALWLLADIAESVRRPPNP